MDASCLLARWSFLKKESCDALSEFYQSPDKELNATFLTLIPKVPNLMELKDYRPINPVGYG